MDSGNSTPAEQPSPPGGNPGRTAARYGGRTHRTSQHVCVASAALEQSLQELDATRVFISRDLHTRLRLVQGFIDLLQKDAAPSLSEKNLRHLAMLDRATKQMAQILNASRANSAASKKSEVREPSASQADLAQRHMVLAL